MGELMLQTGNYLLSGAIRTMLTGAGLTLATASISTVILKKLIDDLREEISGMPDLALALIDLAGIDVAISLMLSAVLTRNAITSAKVFLTAKLD